MAQAKLSINAPSDAVLSFIVREEAETTGNRFLSFNSSSSVLLFEEIQDGNLHNYRVTIQSPGCLSATQTIAFQCTDSGGCETVRGGEITGGSRVAINQPTPLSVVSLAGTTPYTYQWSTTGGTLSSNTTANTTITFGTVGTYTVTAVVGNCGNSPITLTKTIEVVLETCDKSSTTCYFYSTGYSTYQQAYSAACLDSATFTIGAFSNGVSLGSTAYVNRDSGSCVKLVQGYYAIKNSTNGCSNTTLQGTLINSIIQIDSTGKIVGTQPFTCGVDATLSSLQQPLCQGGVLTSAIASFSGISNADRYKVCEGSSFTCIMTVPDGFVNGSTTAVNLTAPFSGESKVYTIRFYAGSDTSKYKDVVVTVTSPTNCASKAPTPTLDDATNEPLVGTNPIEYRTRISGTADCVGTINVYVLENGGYINKQSVAITNTIWEIYPNIHPIGTSGQSMKVTLSCPDYDVESDFSNERIIG